MSDDKTYILDPSLTTISFDIPGAATPADIPLNYVFAAFTVIHGAGYGTALDFLNFNRRMTSVLLDDLHLDPNAANDALISTLNRLSEPRAPMNVDKKQKEELVVSFCYTLLRAKIISRTKAADIAAALLTPGQSINVDAWRSKVDRWADRQNPKLPPVEIRKRGKKENKT